jgi:hypothetical protein
MDIGSIFLILALLILVALFISRPLYDRKFATAEEQVSADQELSTDHEISALLAERDRILNALQELDFDYTLGKIPEEDYPSQRAIMLQKGVEVLRNLDQYQEHGQAQDAEARIEAVIAARRADSQGAGAQRAGAQRTGGLVGRNGPEGEHLVSGAALTADDDLEIILANRRRARQEKLAGFCPQCGSPVQQSDRFCPKCGQKLI